MIEWLLMVLTRHYLFVFRALTVFSKVRKRKFDTILGTSVGSLISFPGKEIRLPADVRRLRTWKNTRGDQPKSMIEIAK